MRCCRILLAEFNMSTLLFLLIRVFIDPTLFGTFLCGPLQSFVVNVCNPVIQIPEIGETCIKVFPCFLVNQFFLLLFLCMPLFFCFCKSDEQPDEFQAISSLSFSSFSLGFSLLRSRSGYSHAMLSALLRGRLS